MIVNSENKLISKKHEVNLSTFDIDWYYNYFKFL